MKIQEKPDYLIFADSAKKGEVNDFPDVSRGWGITIEQTGSKPPMEWMNGAFNRIDKNMLYLLQQGISEWSESVIYPVNAIIKHKGVLYIALAENDNVDPSKNKSKWRQLQADDFNALPAQKKINAGAPIYEVGEQVSFKKTPLFNNSELILKNDYQNSTGFRRSPDGFIYQWGEISIAQTSDYAHFTVVFPVAFNEYCCFFNAAYRYDACFVTEQTRTKTYFTGTIFERLIRDTIVAGRLVWFAVGR